MLEKTLSMLAKYPPGTATEEPCFDMAELAELAQILMRLLYSPYPVRRQLQRAGVTVTPANFYSEIPTIDSLEDTKPSVAGGFDAIFDVDVCDRVLGQLVQEAESFDPPLDGDRANPAGFFWSNPAYSFSDAMSCYAFMKAIKPKTVVEIGSGWSTLVTRQALSENEHGRILCIEPYPLAFLPAFVAEEALIRKPVQDVAVEFFNDTLADGDVLFIDSTHTVKHGSDCLYIYLKALPQIRRNIFVHVHDIFLPNTMPPTYARDKQIYWTEQYLLYAYLLGNPRTRVLYGSAYHHYRRNPLLTQMMHDRHAPGGGSFWFYQGDNPALLDGVFPGAAA